MLIKKVQPVYIENKHNQATSRNIVSANYTSILDKSINGMICDRQYSLIYKIHYGKNCQHITNEY